MLPLYEVTNLFNPPVTSPFKWSDKQIGWIKREKGQTSHHRKTLENSEYQNKRAVIKHAVLGLQVLEYLKGGSL